MKNETFIINDSPKKEGFRTFPVGKGRFLHAGPDLNVFASGNGRAFLLGYAVNSVPSKQNPEKTIETLSEEKDATEEIIREKRAWGGRFAVVTDGKILSDGAGLMSAFYCPEGVSNNLRILAEETGRTPEMRPKEFMDWIPAPATACEGISRLLPTTGYDVLSGTLFVQEILPDEEWMKEAGLAGNPYTVSAEIMQEFIRNLVRKFPARNVLVSITGGRDSRTVFAACRAAGIPFEAFTFRNADMPAGDMRTAKAVCKATGVVHREIKRKNKPDEARLAEYDAEYFGASVGRDREYWGTGAYDDVLFENSLMLRGGVSEASCLPYSRFFSDEVNAEEVISFYQLSGRNAEAIRNYMQIREAYPQAGMSNQGRFYLDQRCGCWLSVIESGFAMYDGVLSFHPFNCPALMKKTKEIPDSDRVAKQHLEKITVMMCPDLIGIPYAGDSLRDRIAGIPRKIRWRLRL